MRPFESKHELLCTIPGVAERTAEVILAEFGPDMERFPSHRHAASWAAICPGHDESAGKRRTGKTRQGNRWPALVEAAQSAAGRTKDTYLHAQCAHQAPPRTQEGDRRGRPGRSSSLPITSCATNAPIRSSAATTFCAVRIPSAWPSA